MAPLPIQRDASRLPPDTAACLGAFDGFHLGHQALFTAARGHCGAVSAVTFDPHPLRVLAPERAPQLLQTPIQRVRVATALGLDRLVLLPFDRELATQSPQTFTTQFLTEGLRPRAVIVGADFRFGAHRQGTPAMLRELLATHGITTEIVPPIPHPLHPEHKLSSTDVRKALRRGEVALAGSLLGRWHAAAGTVVRGAARGRALGYRTANVECPGALLPPEGIYATALTVWDESSPLHGACWPSVTNLGRNPTFVEDGPVLLETHVLDTELGEALYGLEVEISFIERLREELAFPDAETLVRQIEQDVADARTHLGPEAMDRVLRPLSTPPKDLR